jgi:hypothetical protein
MCHPGEERSGVIFGSSAMRQAGAAHGAISCLAPACEIWWWQRLLYNMEGATLGLSSRQQWEGAMHWHGPPRKLHH